MQSRITIRGFVRVAACASLLHGVPWAAGGKPCDAVPTSRVVVDQRLHPKVNMHGFVLTPDGSPAAGALVVSSAGGKAITDAAGSYLLEVDVPSEAASVQVTAGSGGNLIASSVVALGAAPRVIHVDPLRLAQGGPCSPAWLPTFGGEPGTNAAISALAVYDDGSGPELYAGGYFTTAGGAPASYIAKWDGSSWAALGSGMSGLDDDVLDLAVYDDGGGPALYACGAFTHAGGVAVNYIAKWDGSSWAALGSGVSGRVFTLAVYDDGAGPELHAGGLFGTAGGASAASIARWNGSSWSPLGRGTSGVVQVLAVHDDGGGPALYAGGNFTSVGGVPARNLARWRGSSWAALSDLSGPSTPSVSALAEYDDGSGPALYAGGSFATAGGVAASGIAKWDGSSWSALGTGVDSYVSALAVYDDGGGPAVFAGGSFSTAGGVPVSNIGRWDGSSWSALGAGTNTAVTSLVVHDDGGGPALYAGGPLPLSGRPPGRIAKWEGSRWMELGSGFGHNRVSCLAVFDAGGGPELYAGGDFPGRIVRWDGSSWSVPGGGVDGVRVHVMTVYDDGRGPALYVGGNFWTAGGVSATGIARWDGSSWSALGGSLQGGALALAVHDDGGGPALYAGGQFTSAGGVPVNHIARWDGSSWSALGGGVSGEGVIPKVLALSVYDDGGGPALYAGGSFTSAGGTAASRIAKWDGSSWAALGSGMSGPAYVPPEVHALAVYDDGSGPALHAGGQFWIAGGVAANRIAKWDGSSWTPLGSGVSSVQVESGYSAVRALVVFDGPERGGPALYAGGDFSSALDSQDSYVARWQGCPDVIPPVLSCPDSVTVPDPRPGPRGEIVTFVVTAMDERDASPSVVCVPPSGSHFPPGVTLVQCKATDGAGNQSICSFPVTVQRNPGP